MREHRLKRNLCDFFSADQIVLRLYFSSPRHALLKVRNPLLVLSINATQEKVEEDRYIRAREAELREAKAKAAAAEGKAKELEAKSAELVAKKTAAMNEVAALLAKTGDVVSETGLANLVDWKH